MAPNKIISNETELSISETESSSSETESSSSDTESSSSKGEYDLEPHNNTLDWSFPWPSRDNEPQLFELCGKSVYAFRFARNVWSNIIFSIVVFGQLFILVYLVYHLEEDSEVPLKFNGWILGLLILAISAGQHFWRGVQLIKLSCSCASTKVRGYRRRDLFLVGLADIMVGWTGFLCGYTYGTSKSQGSSSFIAETIAIMFVEQFDEVAFKIIMYISPNWHRSQVKKLKAMDFMLSRKDRPTARVIENELV
jgi:hypothetical protein